MPNLFSKSVIIRLSTSATSVSAGPVTGIIFPTPGEFDYAGDGIMFLFSGANLPAHTPATYIFKVKYSQHAWYYTNFFWAAGFGHDFTDDNGYYGCHPYPDPPPSGLNHYWEISTNFDDINLDGSQIPSRVGYGIWYTQAVVVSGSLTKPVIRYYPDLTTSATRFIHFDWATSPRSFDYTSATAALAFADNPWPTEHSEALDGVFRGLQIYSTNLSYANIITEAANDSINTPQTAAGLSSVWYMNQNPTSADISDKSGAGHNPVWLNARRPSTYTG